MNYLNCLSFITFSTIETGNKVVYKTFSHIKQYGSLMSIQNNVHLS